MLLPLDALVWFLLVKRGALGPVVHTAKSGDPSKGLDRPMVAFALYPARSTPPAPTASAGPRA